MESGLYTSYTEMLEEFNDDYNIYNKMIEIRCCLNKAQCYVSLQVIIMVITHITSSQHIAMHGFRVLKHFCSGSLFT